MNREVKLCVLMSLYRRACNSQFKAFNGTHHSIRKNWTAEQREQLCRELTAKVKGLEQAISERKVCRRDKRDQPRVETHPSELP
jgi:hypothetical protein